MKTIQKYFMLIASFSLYNPIFPILPQLKPTLKQGFEALRHVGPEEKALQKSLQTINNSMLALKKNLASSNLQSLSQDMPFFAADEIIRDLTAVISPLLSSHSFSHKNIYLANLMNQIKYDIDGEAQLLETIQFDYLDTIIQAIEAHNDANFRNFLATKGYALIEDTRRLIKSLRNSNIIKRSPPTVFKNSEQNIARARERAIDRMAREKAQILITESQTGIDRIKHIQTNQAAKEAEGLRLAEEKKQARAQLLKERQDAIRKEFKARRQKDIALELEHQSSAESAEDAQTLFDPKKQTKPIKEDPKLKEELDALIEEQRRQMATEKKLKEELNTLIETQSQSQ